MILILYLLIAKRSSQHHKIIPKTFYLFIRTNAKATNYKSDKIINISALPLPESLYFEALAIRW